MEFPSDPTLELPVLYEDNFLIAVHKPSGLFVHRSEADRSVTDFVLQRVRNQVKAFVYPVHRLDRATSGLLLLAKDRQTAADLGQLFEQRQVLKVYRALVRGHCSDVGEICDPLISARGRSKPEGHPFREPQHALTKFQTLQRYELPYSSGRYPTSRCCLVDVQPITGRWHQIRRHLNYFSHPIIGDTAHGDTRQNHFFAETLQVQRLMLAAIQLNLPHPRNGHALQIECPPDADFTNVLDRLQTWQLPATEQQTG
jgi:tRNA pseudouridine65 synthase